MSQCQIVLIEDNPGDVFLIRLALKENGLLCEMTLFNNGEEALLVLCPPEGSAESDFVPDAILLDLNTPKSDGFNILARLRQSSRLAEVPIAIITSSQATADRDRIASLSGIRYVQKPSHLDAFLSTLSQAVKEMLSRTTGGPV